MKKKLYLIKVVFLTFKSILKKKPRKTYELKIAKMHLYLNQNRQVCTLEDPPPFPPKPRTKKKKKEKKGKKTNSQNKKLR